MLFISPYKQFLFWIFVHVGKWLDKKAKVNFKVSDGTNWITNNYNTNIARYLKKQKQSDNEIWSVNKA